MAFRVDSDDIVVSSQPHKKIYHIKFKIKGKPLAKASLKTYRNKRSYSPVHYQPSQPEMTELKKILKKELLPYIDGDTVFFRKGSHLKIEVSFYFGRAKDHYRSGFLKESAPRFPTKPDLDNLLKFLFDSMGGIVYHDDAQIVHITTIKKYTKDENKEGYTTISATTV